MDFDLVLEYEAALEAENVVERADAAEVDIAMPDTEPPSPQSSSHHHPSPAATITPVQQPGPPRRRAAINALQAMAMAINLPRRGPRFHVSPDLRDDLDYFYNGLTDGANHPRILVGQHFTTLTGYQPERGCFPPGPLDAGAIKPSDAHCPVLPLGGGPESVRNPKVPDSPERLTPMK
ncbi:unnamed protein product [Larinioides sclopetarius]|uniref:Uncharacterized protein n=1 Tax=Larinioides sclopetarius TaxID=280406 RepID=A0AAV1ZTU4_9ARAC